VRAGVVGRSGAVVPVGVMGLEVSIRRGLIRWGARPDRYGG
jgi:hypothetical protein